MRKVDISIDRMRIQLFLISRVRNDFNLFISEAKQKNKYLYVCELKTKCFFISLCEEYGILYLGIAATCSQSNIHNINVVI